MSGTNGGNAGKSLGDRIMDQVPQYGNFGGPGYCHGAWVKDFGNPNIYRWDQWADPVDGQDELYLEHDKAYAWAELQRDLGNISSLEESIMKTKADIQLVDGLAHYNPLDDPRSVVKEYSSMYQVLAMTLFTEKLLYDCFISPELTLVTNVLRDLYNSAQLLNPFKDPLTLDLDGDGIETVAASTTNPILFDHDGDGTKNGTGWIKADDGFLVLDRNNNGTIDSGQELFGDSTPLAGGGTAEDGFAALAQEDTNADGVVNNLDTRWSQLRVWQDLNQDGVSQAGELLTMRAFSTAPLCLFYTA